MSGRKWFSEKSSHFAHFEARFPGEFPREFPRRLTQVKDAIFKPSSHEISHTGPQPYLKSRKYVIFHVLVYRRTSSHEICAFLLQDAPWMSDRTDAPLALERLNVWAQCTENEHITASLGIQRMSLYCCPRGCFFCQVLSTVKRNDSRCHLLKHVCVNVASLIVLPVKQPWISFLRQRDLEYRIFFKYWPFGRNVLQWFQVL